MSRATKLLTTVVLGVAGFILMMSAAAGVPIYLQSFEENTDGWDPFDGGEITRVASGTNGVPSSAGDYHAILGLFHRYDEGTSIFSRWGGYEDVFPANGYVTEVDIYLDMAEADGTAKQVDFSSAISTPEGSHRRDFIFSVGTVAGESHWSATASNNSVGNPVNPARAPLTISETGWYTFRSTFENVGGVLAVRMEVLNSSGIVLNSTAGETWSEWVLSTSVDVIGETVGGNRYGWFIINQIEDLPVDNARKYEINDLPSDMDGDGIPDVLDTQPLVPSNEFSDIPLGNGGATAGRIVSVPDGMTVRLEEVPNPQGVQFYVTGGGINERVEIELYGKAGRYLLPAGNYVLTDPEQQITVSTFSGGPATVQFTLSDGTVITIDVPAGATMVTTEVTEDGELLSLNVEVIVGTVQVNGDPVVAGGEVAFVSEDATGPGGGEPGPVMPGPGVPGGEVSPPGADEFQPGRVLTCESAGATLAANAAVSLSCRVTSAEDGSPVSGTTVTFIIVERPSFGASLGGSLYRHVTTDAQGRASATLNAGGTAGALQVEARSNYQTHRYSFTVQGGAPGGGSTPPPSVITPPNTGSAGLR